MSGRDNPVADDLSRMGIHAVHRLPLSIDFAHMAIVQAPDPQLQKLRTSSTSIKFAECPTEGTSTVLFRDISTGKQCPYCHISTYKLETLSSLPDSLVVRLTRNTHNQLFRTTLNRPVCDGKH